MYANMIWFGWFLFIQSQHIQYVERHHNTKASVLSFSKLLCHKFPSPSHLLFHSTQYLSQYTQGRASEKISSMYYIFPNLNLTMGEFTYSVGRKMFSRKIMRPGSIFPLMGPFPSYNYVIVQPRRQIKVTTAFIYLMLCFRSSLLCI